MMPLEDVASKSESLCKGCDRPLPPVGPEIVVSVQRGLVVHTLKFHEEPCLLKWLLGDYHENDSEACEKYLESIGMVVHEANGISCMNYLDKINPTEAVSCPLNHPHCEVALGR